MGATKYRARGKLSTIFPVSYTQKQHSPYQSFQLEGDSRTYNYFGPVDLTQIGSGTEMDFQYELRGKFANVRELDGFQDLPRIDMKALKDQYSEQGAVSGTDKPVQEPAPMASVQSSEQGLPQSEPRPPEKVEYFKAVSNESQSHF